MTVRIFGRARKLADNRSFPADLRLRNCYVEYRHASVDIYIDPTVHRHGHVTDAIHTMIEYLFDVRGHHRLTVDPAAGNEAAIACYSRIGSKPVGVMRSYELRGDEGCADGLLMDMLVTDQPTN